MASSLNSKTIAWAIAEAEEQIEVAESRIAALQAQKEAFLEKIKHLKGLQKYYEPPPVKREPPRKRDKAPPEAEQEQPTGNHAAGTSSSENTPVTPAAVPPIATTVMNVERPPGQAATSIPSDGPVPWPTEEQRRGGR